MLDIKEVIKGLQIERECVSRNCDRDCGKCDLVQERDWLLAVYDNAIELLKEQEPVRVGKKMKAGDVVLDFYECGYCKNAIRKPWKYCPFCGKAVNWNGFDRQALV